MDSGWDRLWNQKKDVSFQQAPFIQVNAPLPSGKNQGVEVYPFSSRSETAKKVSPDKGGD